jgi:hypothetical protein
VIGSSCTISVMPGSPVCDQICNDGQMNQYVAKCSTDTHRCECFYNGRSTCSCTISTQACSVCCPTWGL